MCAGWAEQERLALHVDFTTSLCPCTVAHIHQLMSQMLNPSPLHMPTVAACPPASGQGRAAGRGHQGAALRAIRSAALCCTVLCHGDAVPGLLLMLLTS
jgi:hypothetical protein